MSARARSAPHGLMEGLFYHQKDSNAPSTAAYDPNDPESYNAYLRAMFSTPGTETAFLSMDQRRARRVTITACRQG